MLDPRARTHADFRETGQAWAAAQAWRGDPEADQAATLATERLRELRPDEMRLYDGRSRKGRTRPRRCGTSLHSWTACGRGTETRRRHVRQSQPTQT